MCLEKYKDIFRKDFSVASMFDYHKLHFQSYKPKKMQDFIMINIVVNVK